MSSEYEQSPFGENTDAEVTSVSTHILDFISAASLAPSLDWITDIENQPAGTHVLFAKLIGVATDASIKETSYGPSVRLDGEFEAESLVTGECFASKTAYLPKKWGNLVYEALAAIPADDPNRKANMVITLGCRSTGKPIRHAWTVQTQLERRVSPTMQRLREAAQGIAAPRRLKTEPTTIDAEAAA